MSHVFDLLCLKEDRGGPRMRGCGHSIDRCGNWLILLVIFLTCCGLAGAGPLYVYTDAQG